MKSKLTSKRIISFAFVLIMLVAMMAMAFTPASAETDRVNAARNSVAAVMLYFEDSASSTFLPNSETATSLGSCFFVGDTPENPQYCITNYHVISDYYQMGKGDLITLKFDDGSKRTGRMKIRVYFDTVQSNNFIEAYPVEVDDKYDIALLRLENATNQRTALPIASPTDDMVGKEVYVLGFPGLTENFNVAATSHFRVSDVSITSGIISRLFTQQGTGWKNILIDANIKEGNSGGPLLTSDGKVIGVNTWSTPLATVRLVDGAAFTAKIEEDYFSVNIDHAVSLLNRNGVKYMSSYSDDSGVDNPVEETTVQPTTVQPTTVQPTTNNPTNPVTDPTKESGTTTDGFDPKIIIIIAIAVVVVAIIIVVIAFLVSNKKKSAAKMNPPQNGGTVIQGPGPNRQVPPTASQPNMRGPGYVPDNRTAYNNEGAGETSVLNDGAGETTVLGGQSAGFKLLRKRNNEQIKVNKSEFLIGKERRRVDYCISDNNSISRIHARFTVRGGRCYISDLGSTNCTYVNGNKLTPNQEVVLSAGDTIKISDEEFSFMG